VWTVITEALVSAYLPIPVASLTQRRLDRLPPDTRPLPSVAVYNQLLRYRAGRRAAGDQRP
jgi:hypothetical protein